MPRASRKRKPSKIINADTEPVAGSPCTPCMICDEPIPIDPLMNTAPLLCIDCRKRIIKILYPHNASKKRKRNAMNMPKFYKALAEYRDGRCSMREGAAYCGLSPSTFWRWANEEEKKNEQ